MILFLQQYEAYHWIYAACLLIADLNGETTDYKPMDLKFDMNQFSKAKTGKHRDQNGLLSFNFFLHLKPVFCNWQHTL